MAGAERFVYRRILLAGAIGLVATLVAFLGQSPELPPAEPAREGPAPAEPAPSPPVRRDFEPPLPPTVPPPGGATSWQLELRARHLLLPVQGVVAGDLADSFGDRRGGGRRHEAIDVLAPRNTPVLAVDDGRLARIFLSAAGGLTLYQFDSTERYCYYYAHLERYARGLQEGGAVERGQVLGYVGTSGNAPPGTPHLHFAIFRLGPDKRWWEGEALNPFAVLGPRSAG